jgi:hypothetical protein
MFLPTSEEVRKRRQQREEDKIRIINGDKYEK